jgi:hypothetical protein
VKVGLIVYTRANCPLCDALKDELVRIGMPFEERDIVTCSEWYQRYRERVPVVMDPSGAELDPPFGPARLGALKRLWG